jgi:hypothetical protein
MGFLEVCCDVVTLHPLARPWRITRGLISGLPTCWKSEACYRSIPALNKGEAQNIKNYAEEHVTVYLLKSLVVCCSL